MLKFEAHIQHFSSVRVWSWKINHLMNHKVMATHSRFYLVLLQYETSINNKKLQSEVSALRPVADRLDNTNHDFRVDSEEDNARLTGCSHNAITPFGMLEDIPIILSMAIILDSPIYQLSWMDGGHNQCKVRMAVSDFINVKSPSSWI